MPYICHVCGCLSTVYQDSGEIEVGQKTSWCKVCQCTISCFPTHWEIKNTCMQSTWLYPRWQYCFFTTLWSADPQKRTRSLSTFTPQTHARRRESPLNHITSWALMRCRTAPVEELRAVEPSLYDRPSPPVTHVAVGLHRRRAAPGPEAVETAGVGTRGEHIGAVWSRTQREEVTSFTYRTYQLFNLTGESFSSDTVGTLSYGVGF